ADTGATPAGTVAVRIPLSHATSIEYQDHCSIASTSSSTCPAWTMRSWRMGYQRRALKRFVRGLKAAGRYSGAAILGVTAGGECGDGPRGGAGVLPALPRCGGEVGSAQAVDTVGGFCGAVSPGL